MPHPLARRRMGRPSLRDRYLLYDSFGGTYAAGAVNGTLCDTGQARTVVQLDGELSISGGRLHGTAQTTPSNAHLGIYYDPYSRTPGRILLWKFLSDQTTGYHPGLCWSSLAGLQIWTASPLSIHMGSSGTIIGETGSHVIGTYAAATEYEVALIL